MMNTQSNKADHGVIQSSIALLQERFRQVQRVKEMRENKELLRMFSDYKNTPIPTTTSTTVTNIIPSTTVTTTSTSSGNNISINLNDKINLINKNNSPISEDCTMQYNDDNDNDELQIFIPPNYFSNKNRNSSCYSSSSSATSTTSTSLSHNNHMINLNDVSLSLWPPMSYTTNNSSISNNNNNVAGFGDTLSMLRPTAVAKEVLINRPTTCAYMEDSHHHVSDVDTTLHL